MDIGAIAQWAATGVISFALVLSIRRNGREQKNRDNKIAKETATREVITQQELKHIKAAVTSPASGLEALKEDIGEIKTNCAAVTSGFTARIKELERTKRR